MKQWRLTPRGGHSIEAAARTARYAALAKHIDNNKTCLLTAHHRDDQAETVLLQLCRGAGVRGLAAMPALTTFADGYIARPFLAIPRTVLVAYANAEQLQWLDDDSNQSLRFDRNFIRHEIMPRLRTRWPAVDKTLARSATHCAMSQTLNQTLAKQDLRQFPKQPITQLSIITLRTLTFVRQVNVLRYWFELNQLPIPSHAQLQRILHDMCTTNSAANPVFEFSGKTGEQLRRYQDTLYALSQPPQAVDHTWRITWDITTPLVLPYKLGKLHAVPTTQSTGLCLPQGAVLQLCFRQGGERFHPHGRVGSHPLKKLCQEWQIPPWQRNQLVLGYWQDQLVMVFNPATSLGHYAKPIQLADDFTYFDVQQIILN